MDNKEMQLLDIVAIVLQSEGIEYFVENYIAIREEFFANKNA